MGMTQRLLLLVLVLGQSGLAHAQSRAQAWEDRARNVECRNYTLMSDLPEPQARIVADNIDQLHDTCVKFFKELKGTPPYGDQVCVFADKDDYMAWLRESINVDGTGSAGMFVSRGSQRAIVAWKGNMRLSDLLGVLRHEGFHHFASVLFPDIPIWANEGIAELFERAVPVSNGLALGNVRSRDVLQLRQLVEQNALLPLNQFFRQSSKSWNLKVQRGDASTNYLQAWAVVQFLLYGDDGKYKDGFLGFLGGMNRGLPWQQAFQEAYGVRNYALLQKHFLRWVEDLRPSDLERVVPRMILMGEGLAALGERGEQFTDAGSVAGRLTAAGFECTVPEQFGGGQFTTRNDDPFDLGDATGGRLALCDQRGKPLRQPTRRPCVIAKGLAPRELMLRWKTDGTWELLVDD